jgi:hypothetical protein
MPLLLVGGLAILLTAFVAYGLAFLSRSQAGGTFGWLTGFLKLTAAPLIFVTEQVTKLTSWLTHAIGTHFAAVEWHAVNWLSGLADYLDYTGESIAGIMYDLDHSVRWLVGTEIPKLIKAIPTEIGKAVHYVTTRVVHIERTIVKLPGLTKAQIRAAVAVAIPGLIAHDLPYFDWLRKHLKALERVIAGGTVGALGGLLHLPKDLVGIRKRLARLERLGIGGLAAGAVAAALAALGASWIRCNNWKRLGRAGCQLDSSVITELLGLGLTATVVVEFREIVKLAQSVETVTAQGIHDVLNV